MIDCEDKVNMALKRLVEAHAYSNPPYPTSIDLMKQFRAVTPDSLQSMLYDMFESITLFSNRVTDASYRQLENDQYLLYLTIDPLNKKTLVQAKQVLLSNY